MTLEYVSIVRVELANCRHYWEDVDQRALDDFYRLFHIHKRLQELRGRLKKYYGDRE